MRFVGKMELVTLLIALLMSISINAEEPYYSATVSAATEVDGECQRVVTVSGKGIQDKIRIDCTSDASVITTDDHLIVGDVLFSDEPNSLVIVGEKCLERKYKDGEETAATILSDKECSVVRKSIREGKEKESSGGSDWAKGGFGFGSWGNGGLSNGDASIWEGNNWWNEEFGDGGNMEDYEYGGNWGNAAVNKGVNDVTERLSQWGSSGLTQGSSGLTQGNSGLTQGNSGLTQSNSGLTQGNSGFAQGNSGFTQGNSGFTQGNSGFTQGFGQENNGAGYVASRNGGVQQISSTGNGRTGSGFDFGIGAATNLAGNVVKLGTGVVSDVAGGLGNVFTSFGNVFTGNRG